MSAEPIRVCVGGEGPNDIGRPDQHDGAVQVLIRKIGGDRLMVVRSRRWKDIKKFKAGDHRNPEERNVLGLALEASETKCGALVFVRDRDEDVERERMILAAIDKATLTFAELRVAGGVATEALEAWVLAAKGEAKSETHRHPKLRLEQRHQLRTTAEKVAAFESLDERKLPKDAKSFRTWIQRVRALTVPGAS